MKRLILMRHAKAKQYGDPGISDLERDLEDRGIKDSKQMGKRMRQDNLIPDKIICSHSNRTKQTLEQILKELKADVKIETNPAIYGNNENEILGLIVNESNDVGSLMIIGHNPSIEGLASMICEEPLPGGKFGTANIAVIDLDWDDWSKVKEGQGRLAYFMSPGMRE